MIFDTMDIIFVAASIGLLLLAKAAEVYFSWRADRELKNYYKRINEVAKL